ncbi:short-chain dehydrogenase [Aspergillus niger]|uniref:short-chain dehydrogenase n=1 Tax=Aspergillus lacticoffeatus (strain CBS 101883) TaxID=1450533 RepID=UPI000D7F5C67|nr:short-chain dehydrogenase [Aspergillus niger CBS 101883]PYH53679.1 short-chain dehydrogenase [Aspergillus niger CBS 101883]GJP96673.1 short-chain dehydrogenase [Aspergillus niger]
MFTSTKTTFTFSTDIPSLKDKVIMVTGGNSGLGKQSIVELAKHRPKEVWLAARDPKRAAAAVTSIKCDLVEPVDIKILDMDLTSLDSVKRAAERFRSESSRLDILLLNAGIMSVPPGLTNEGYEIQFGTNHMGHALLAKLLVPVLLKTATIRDPVRHLKNRADGMNTVARYGQSKLANLLWGREMARHYPQLTVPLVHPGLVRTNLATTMGQGSLIMRILWWIASLVTGVDVETGTLNQLWAATYPRVESGQYYVPVGKTRNGSKYAQDLGLGKKLWEWTEMELEAYLNG